MTELLKNALNALDRLPREQQDEIALAVMAMIEDATESADIPEAHMTDIRVAIAQIERGEFASEEDVKAVFASFQS